MLAMDNNIAFYNTNNKTLIAQYDSVAAETVHSDWLSFLPESGSLLDIGAGSGRDARYFASRGLNVVAVEPAQRMLDEAKRSSTSPNIVWLADSLPMLSQTTKLGTTFDVVLLSAVWMHLSPEARRQSMMHLAPLVKNTGVLVITLRYGEFSDARTAYAVSSDEVRSLASQVGLSVRYVSNLNDDQLGRGEVAWQTVVLGK